MDEREEELETVPEVPLLEWVRLCSAGGGGGGMYCCFC